MNWSIRARRRWGYEMDTPCRPDCWQTPKTSPKMTAATRHARRRAYDWRAALLLIQQGVTDFATVNEKDFRDCGFQRFWNPLAAD